MRGLKSTLFFVVVLAGLGAYIYFVTWKTPEGGGDSTSKPKEKVFAALQADKIEELKVSSSAGDKDYRQLFLGEKTPTGADLFAKRNDEKKVFLVQAFQEATFDKKPFDLRDKVLLKFDREKIDGVDVASGGKALAFAKDGGDWKITKSVQVKGDFGSVEGLIGKLQNAAMKSIVADQPSAADLKKYGLDKPEATVNLAAGSAKATLIVVGKAENNTVYAR